MARLKGIASSLPVKQHKIKVTNRYFNYIYVRMGAYTFIHKRSGNDIWKNLYEPPLVETDREWTEEELYASPQFRGMLSGGEGAHSAAGAERGEARVVPPGDLRKFL